MCPVSGDCSEETALAALLGEVVSGAVIAASVPWKLCPLASTLAAVRGATVLTWSCPHVEASRGMLQLVPGVAARTVAIVQLHRLFRWRRTALVIADDPDGWGYAQSSQLQMALRAEGVQVRNRIKVGRLPGPLLQQPHSQGYKKKLKPSVGFLIF